MKKKKIKNNSKKKEKKEKSGGFELPGESKRLIEGVLMILAATIILLSFFNKAGVAGQAAFETVFFLIGRAVFVVPLVFLLGGLVFFRAKYKNFFWPVILAIIIFILGISG